MKTITVTNQVIAGKDAGRYVTVVLRRGRIFGGLVKSVKAKCDAVEISWHFGTVDLIESKQVVAVSFRKIGE